MSLKNDAFPSSVAFDLIADALKDEAEKKDAIKRGNAVFCFTLKNTSGETASWYIDLKSTGTVGTGEAPAGGKADSMFNPRRVTISDLVDITLSLSEDNFGKLVQGKANAQRLFMGGALKVKGDVMKATKAEVVLKKAQAKRAKL
ncbi:hypothetical protein ABW19_dt0202243 [Dactylella cylindrospora]|nr:hypothetical protein ABW19_dt0202243 [Dactylella cylindrospora]